MKKSKSLSIIIVVVLLATVGFGVFRYVKEQKAAEAAMIAAEEKQRDIEAIYNLAEDYSEAVTKLNYSKEFEDGWISADIKYSQQDTAAIFDTYSNVFGMTVKSWDDVTTCNLLWTSNLYEVMLGEDYQTTIVPGEVEFITYEELCAEQTNVEETLKEANINELEFEKFARISVEIEVKGSKKGSYDVVTLYPAKKGGEWKILACDEEVQKISDSLAVGELFGTISFYGPEADELRQKIIEQANAL